VILLLNSFYPTDAILARVLAMDLCLSVSLSVCHKSVFYQNGLMNRAGFRMWASFHPSYAVLKGNLGICKNKSCSTWNCFLNCGLRKISPRHIDCRNALSTQLENGGRSQRDKLDQRRSAKLTMPSSSDVRPLQFITVIVKLCLHQRGSISGSWHSFLTTVGDALGWVR